MEATLSSAITKTEHGLNRLGYWVTGYTVISAVFSWAAKHLTIVGPLGWPEAVFLGVAVASLILVVLSVVLMAWRYFNSSTALREAGVGSPAASGSRYDGSALQSKVAELSRTVRAVIDDYQKMSSLEIRVNDGLESLKNTSKIEMSVRKSEIQTVERKINELMNLAEKLEHVRVDGAIATRDIEKLRNTQKDHRDRTLHSFFAIGARERLTIIASDIMRDASNLYDRLHAGETYDIEKWQQWENVHHHWRGKLTEWLDTGTWYAISVKERTLTIDDAKYALDWSILDSQFPHAEAVRVFKKFRIIQQQWEIVLPQVLSGIEKVAFTGVTELEVRSGHPAG